VYLYFGITPALLLFWPYAALTGHYLSHKDAVVFFLSVGFLAGAGLLFAVWRRYFRETGVGAVAAGTLALGLANFAPMMLERCQVHEVALSCGYALTMLALAAVWSALQGGPRGGRWLAAASLAYGLALGARPSLLFGAVILLAPVAQAWRERRPSWRLWLAATGPIVLIGLGLMLYNALRFDNPLVFGDSYQLPLSEKQLFRARYLWYNLRVGFLDPARWGLRFPFVHDAAVPPPPAGYDTVDHPFGILTNIPLVWLALAAPLAWRRRPAGGERSRLRWFLAAVGLLFGMGALTLCLHDSMCVRYELELVSPLVFLAVIGALALKRVLDGRTLWRRAVGCGWGLLLVFSVALNLLASFSVRADIHINLGVRLMKAGRVDEAITEYRKAVDINPDYAQSRNNLGNALAVKGNLDDAIAQYRRALDIEPDYSGARNNFGLALFQKGEVEQAIEQYHKALEIVPHNAGALSNLGNALLTKGKLDDAMTCFRKAVAMDPEQVDAWFDLGNVFVQKGDLESAIASYRQVIRIVPNSADAHAILGEALSQKGQTKEAVASWEQALEIKPDQAAVQNNLAWSLATTPDASLRNGARAVALAGRANQLAGGGNPMFLRTLAAAYAEEGSYGLAAVTARRALDLAVAQNNDALAGRLQTEIQLYEADTPFRDGTTEGGAPTGRVAPQ
jgi:tetratricopeptide (TPR) repeat protein